MSLARKLCSEVYHFYGWTVLKPDAELRKKVLDQIIEQVSPILSEFPKIERLEGDFPEQFMRRGAELVGVIHDMSGVLVFAKNPHFNEIVMDAKKELETLQRLALKQENLGVQRMWGMLAEEISKSPARGLINYKKQLIGVFQNSNLENKDELISLHQTAIDALQPKIDGQFTRLYPGAMLYKFLVISEILSKSLFSKAIKLFEDTLCWDLPTGVDLETML